MKKALLALTAGLLSLSAAAQEAETPQDIWVMPGTYQGWKLETNLFTDNGDGTFSQTIADLYGDFKIVCYTEGAVNWNNQWGTNGSQVVNNTAYVMTFNGNNAEMSGMADNMHYINAKVTITPDANNPKGGPLTILVEADRVEEGNQTWVLVGENPGWDLNNPNKFEKDEEGNWVLFYEGTIDGEFKVVKNGSWKNAYSTMGTVNLNEEYTLTGPEDPLDNMSPAEAWENPKFVLTVTDEAVKMLVTLDTGVAVAEAENAPAVYFDLQGRRVSNPAAGLYIVKTGSKVQKVFVK